MATKAELTKKAFSLMADGGYRKHSKELEEIAKQMAAIKPRGGFGRGESNFVAHGEIINPKVAIKNLTEGIYMVKAGVLRRMKDSNGTGNVCVVYRVPPKKTVVVPEPVAKKVRVKKQKIESGITLTPAGEKAAA